MRTFFFFSLFLFQSTSPPCQATVGSIEVVVLLDGW